MKRTYLLFSIVVAIALLLAVSGVKADGTYPYPLSLGNAVPPRVCTINGWGGVQVTIEAGPDLTKPLGLSDQFPLSAWCGPPETEYEPCLQWQYRWTVVAGSANLKEAYVSVDSDITVLKADAPVHISKILQTLNIGEAERFLDFTVPGGTTFTASYSTPLNVTPGTLTAGFVGNKLFLWGHCALAGANNVIAQPGQPVPSLSYNQLPGCLVSFQVDLKGNPIPKTCFFEGLGCEPKASTPLPCSDSDMKIDGETLIYGSPMQWTVPADASCTTCWRNTYGGKTCVTTQTCP
jgi:hypothetical protein